MVTLVFPSTTQTHTADHVNCPACEKGPTLLEACISPELSFPEAFQVWIERRIIEQDGYVTKVRYVSQRTERDLRQYARAAAKFFARVPLDRIHVGHLREYQRARALNLVRVAGEGETHPWEQPAGANLIRKEIQTVLRVMRAAGVWSEQNDKTFELVDQVESDVPRAMSPAEQGHWLRTAAQRPEWRIVYAWSIVALQTTAATNEMRSLRLGDIFLDSETLQIRSEGAKNRFRIRTIPLQTPDVVWALGELLSRAKRMGANGPHCYLFPLHVTADRYDPLQPMTVWGIRKPWDAVRKASGLTWLRVYDLRHTAITRMAEAGVPIQVIMSFAGHVSERMQQHYTAISMQARRRWAATAWANADMPFAPPPLPEAAEPMRVSELKAATRRA